MDDADHELYARAAAARGGAYAPYSKFQVGARCCARDGTLVEGVNVENAAYPLGVCAERTRVSSHAVDDGLRPGDFDAIAITASPCGGCRQWLVEFGVDRVDLRAQRRRARETRPPSSCRTRSCC